MLHASQPQPPPAEAILTVLINEIAAIPDKTVVGGGGLSSRWIKDTKGSIIGGGDALDTPSRRGTAENLMRLDENVLPEPPLDRRYGELADPRLHQEMVSTITDRYDYRLLYQDTIRLSV
jgi:hypothetical protein